MASKPKKASKKKVVTNPRKTSKASFAIASLQHHFNSQAKIIYRPRTKHNSRAGELHPSSYPFCGLEHAWNIVTGKQREEMNFFGDYYTGLGTFAHELMQRQFGRGKQILGDWKCLDCGKKKALAYYAPCKRCGSEHVEYEELRIEYGRHTVGHVDGVILIDGKLWVIDYKTSSVKNNEKHRQTGTQYPYKYNVAQIKSYCYYLEKYHGLKIEGWMLIYVSRDHLINDCVTVGDIVTDEEKVKLGKKFARYDNTFHVAEKLKKEGKTPKRRAEYFKYLVEKKPCETMADYKEEFWTGYEIKCDLAKDGTCFNSHRLKTAIKNKLNGTKVLSVL